MEIRKAVTADIPTIQKLFSVVTHKSERFLQWWLSETHIPAVIFCAIEGGAAVGMFVVFKRKLGNGLTCGVLMGLIVHPKWRGKGLFKELGERAMAHWDDIDMFCCLTNRVGKRALERNFHFKTVDTINTMLLDDIKGHEAETVSLQAITRDVQFKYLNKQAQDVPYMFLADYTYRQWRYALHPYHAYQMMKLESGEYAITKTYTDGQAGQTYGDIDDFEPETLEEKNLYKLLLNVSSSLKRVVDVVTIQAIPRSLLFRVAKELGFQESETNHFFCMQVKESRYEELYNAQKWLVKWGDYLR